jgi:hypothetical protein
LKLGVFEGGVGHVVDEGDAQRGVVCGCGGMRGDEAFRELEKGWNAAALNRDWHF